MFSAFWQYILKTRRFYSAIRLARIWLDSNKVRVPQLLRKDIVEKVRKEKKRKLSIKILVIKMLAIRTI